ncbi:MAG: hypothetical protein KJN82_06185 [Bacteroidia bacterium]|nr:hypothetical protein [Bacteroidia bacterium]
MNIIKEAENFAEKKQTFKTTSDRIVASRKAKELILDLNELYKLGHDPRIMDLMKRLTVVKQKIEKRLKGRPLTV